MVIDLHPKNPANFVAYRIWSEGYIDRYTKNTEKRVIWNISETRHPYSSRLLRSQKLLQGIDSPSDLIANKTISFKLYNL